MSKTTNVSLEEQLLCEWLKGWPEYYVNVNDDYPSILGLFNQIADYLHVNGSDDVGYERCCLAITRISTYCRNNWPWAGKNLHFYNRAFQTLKNEMGARERMKKIKSFDYKYKK